VSLFLAADAAIFRLGWYNKYLEPQSSAGTAELHLFWLRHQPRPKNPDVMVVGDSRIAEGFSPWIASHAIGGKIHFESFGMPGATPRVWYYVLRDADPKRDRFAAIAFPVTPYSDEDQREDLQNTIADLNYSIGRLNLRDCPDFARSFNDPDLCRRALTGCLFPGTTLRRDLREFLADIPGRIARARDFRNNGPAYLEAYGGKLENVAGLSADWKRRILYFPPGLTPLQIETIRKFVMPPPVPQTGALTRYRKLWFGRILDLYRNSATRIIFFELPRAPVPLPETEVAPRFIESVAGRSGVSVLPAATFRDLERPEIFADGLHLNHAGRPLFSARLATRIAAVLAKRGAKEDR
jgi:hypothetical protein